MVWLKTLLYSTAFDKHQERQQTAYYGKFVIDDKTLYDVKPINRNLLSGRKLSHGVELAYRDRFRVDGSQVNSAIMTVSGTVPGLHYRFRGPFMAAGKIGLGGTAYRDVTMDDFRHIANFFMSWTPTSAPGELWVSIPVQGVRLNCIGDQELFGRPVFEHVTVASNDPIFNDHDTSDIADRIGLSLFTRRYFPNPKWARDADKKLYKDTSPYTNDPASILHLCCDPNAEYLPQTKGFGWGYVPSQWEKDVGSILIVRKDISPLSTLDIEALCNYCRDDIQPLFAKPDGEHAGSGSSNSDELLAMISRTSFSVKWRKLQDEKRKEGKDADVPFPYDLENTIPDFSPWPNARRFFTGSAP